MEWMANKSQLVNKVCDADEMSELWHAMFYDGVQYISNGGYIFTGCTFCCV